VNEKVLCVWGGGVGGGRSVVGDSFSFAAAVESLDAIVLAGLPLFLSRFVF
jgi:hypothetical protein